MKNLKQKIKNAGILTLSGIMLATGIGCSNNTTPYQPVRSHYDRLNAKIGNLSTYDVDPEANDGFDLLYPSVGSPTYPEWYLPSKREVLLNRSIIPGNANEINDELKAMIDKHTEDQREILFRLDKKRYQDNIK